VKVQFFNPLIDGLTVTMRSLAGYVASAQGTPDNVSVTDGHSAVLHALPNVSCTPGACECVHYRAC
jgi:hypothetical protein